MSTPPGPERNHLLAALPARELERLKPYLKPATLSLGSVLHEPGEPMHSAYFPTDCIVSMLYEMENGESAEMAIIGNEGLVGVALVLGGESMMNRALVQSQGHAYRIDAEKLKEEFERHEDLYRLLLKYTQALLAQIAQTAVCNRHHSVVAQLCRWLLLSIDRLPGDNLTMTQQLIADMLGVRRATVTECAGKLQQHGLISYYRGAISVHDRAGLEAMCCECYAVVKKETDRLLDAWGRPGDRPDC